MKKAQQRLYFLRRLRSFGVSRAVIINFYRAVIESILSFSIIAWYGNSTEKERAQLNRVVRTASKIIGAELPPLDQLYQERTIKKAHSIIADDSHPAHHLFELMPSGRRFRATRCRTERFKNSFYPSAVRILSGNT